MSSGPIDMAAVRRGHRSFATANKLMVYNVLQKAGEAAVLDVKKTNRFKRRKPSPRSLKDATRYRVKHGSKGPTLKVWSTKKYAPYVEFATRPHFIKPRRKKALRWRGRQGGWMFAKRVFHPGTRATWFLRTAVNHAHVVTRELIAYRMKRMRFKF